MQILESVAAIHTPLLCTHCDEPVINLYSSQEKSFCCQGCLTVYEVLHSKGLQDYYNIKQSAGIYRRRSPVEIKQAQYLYLDDWDFLSEFSYLNSNQLKTMEFYLEGIHCLACLWLIEKLPHFVEDVIQANLDLEKSVVTVSLNHEGKFSKVAVELNQLGYKPHPLKKNQESHNLKVKEERQFILRIGLAAAGASNIMLYAVSIYAGASDTYAKVFNILTVLFAIPVLTYSAYPFYKNAWFSLKKKNLSIDVPISLSLIVGGLMGVSNLLRGIVDNYFDSLTTLVFLLLLSRYFLKKIQDKALSAKDIHFFYVSECVLRSRNNNHTQFEEIHPKYIAINDILKVKLGEFIPADGKIIKGESYLNLSLLTGESKPVFQKSGSNVFAGTQNLSADILIQVEKTKNETRLGEIYKSVKNGWSKRAEVVNLADKISKYFIASVFLLSAFVFVYYYFQGNSRLALEMTITLLIVTCPCALALAVPLTFTKALSQAAENGFIIKNEAALQKLSQVESIFLDKTGTITHQEIKINSFNVIKQPHSKLKIEDILLSLESGSQHPVAKALVKYAESKKAQIYPVKDYCEKLGRGVEGKIGNYFYSINNSGLFENDELLASFEFQDVLRDDSLVALKNLKALGLDIKILSGDQYESVEKVAKKLGLKTEQFYANMSPEEKSSILKKYSKAMMIGDGANDSIAFANSHVGIAVLGSMEMALKSADVYMVIPGLSSIYKLIVLARETMKVIHRNIILSLLYNLTSVTFVFLGWINPLTAAIIMPLSSLTVLLSTWYGTKKSRLLWK